MLLLRCGSYKMVFLIITIMFMMNSCVFESNRSPGDVGISPQFQKNTNGELVIHSLFPNDLAHNDSSAHYLNSGIFLYLQPKGRYLLKVQFDSNYSLAKLPQKAPVLRLTKTIYKAAGWAITSRYKDVIGTGGKYLWEFAFNTSDLNEVLVSAAVVANGNLDSLSVPVSFVKFSGNGDNTASFGLNCIFVGAHPAYSSDSLQEILADSVYETIARIYGQQSVVTVSSHQLLRAENYPNWGSSFPKQKQYIYATGEYTSDTLLDHLSETPDKSIQNNVDLIFVDRIINGKYADSLKKSPLGLSPVYGLTLGAGYRSKVVIASRAVISSQSGTLSNISITDIANTAAHELGHFFGLRHTTPTGDDMEAEDDYSNQDDGFYDTPNCNDANTSAMHKVLMHNYLAKYFGTKTNCKDRDNLMFYQTEQGVVQEKLSSQQLNLVARNLSLYPH